MSDPDDELLADLLYPFLCVQSKGGPYDEEAFVAGVQLGIIIGRAQEQAEPIEATIYSPMVGTLDLAAMWHGYQVEAVESDEYPEWTHVTLTPTPPLDSLGSSDA